MVAAGAGPGAGTLLPDDQRRLTEVLIDRENRAKIQEIGMGGGSLFMDTIFSCRTVSYRVQSSEGVSGRGDSVLSRVCLQR